MVHYGEKFTFPFPFSLEINGGEISYRSHARLRWWIQDIPCDWTSFSSPFSDDSNSPSRLATPVHKKWVVGVPCKERRRRGNFKWAFSLTFVFSIGLYVFCLCDPVQVAPEVFLNLLFLAELVKVTSGFGLFPLLGKLTAEDTQDEVHDKECPDNHHRDKVRPLPRVPHCIMDLPKRIWSNFWGQGS